MENAFQPLKVQSLKEACIRRMEELVLSGELKIGERLPAERDLAARIGVSRPVLHEALVDLNAKGLVEILPRRGVFVSDYRRSGSMTILSSLLAYRDGNLDPSVTQSLIDMRLVVEKETARQAALHRTKEQLTEFHELLIEEANFACRGPQSLTDLDFKFHLLIAIASGNIVYPLIINSFKDVYTSLTGRFFSMYYGTPIIEAVKQFHIQLMEAIDLQKADQAAHIMTLMLKHGEAYLKGEIP
jgi:GntR family transcriptional repressor for pyruvate dehydrogenase complex